MKTENLFDSLSVQDMIFGDDPVEPQQPAKPEPAANDDEPDDEPEQKSAEPAKPEPKPQDPPAQQQEGDDDDDQGILGTLKQKFGFDFGDQQFDESIDGVFELSKMAAEKLAESHLDEFFRQMPDVAQYAEFRMNGGDPKMFFETMGDSRDYSQVSITEQDTATQRHVVGELLKKQGFDQETANLMLENYSKAGVLFDQSKAALPILAKLDAAEKQTVMERQRQQAAEKERERLAEVELIKNTVKAGTFKGIQIPEAEKTKFQNWLFQAGKDGKTGRNAAREQLTMEDKLALEYLVFKGFKLSDIIQKRVETAKAKDLKSLMKDRQGSRMKDDAAQRTELNIPSVTDLFG